MRKKDELTKDRPCMQTAHQNEMTFVLIGRDAAAPIAIRAWVAERLRLGKNTENDAQITEALECAMTMESEGRKWVDYHDPEPVCRSCGRGVGFGHVMCGPCSDVP